MCHFGNIIQPSVNHHVSEQLAIFCSHPFVHGTALIFCVSYLPLLILTQFLTIRTVYGQTVLKKCQEFSFRNVLINESASFLFVAAHHTHYTTAYTKVYLWKVFFFFLSFYFWRGRMGPAYSQRILLVNEFLCCIKI